MPNPNVRIIAVANQKGGVGKSTTAVSLGAALAELGKKVLVIDLDPQGNASTGLGIRHESREVTVYDVLASQVPIDGAIVPSPIPGLSAIPSTIDLAGAEIELVSQFSRELRLRKALEPLREGDFEFILLDCPPSLGLLTVNALAAAEELIVPIQCEYYALEGLGQLLKNVRLVQQNVNPRLRLSGIVMTMYDPRTKLSEQVVQEVRRFFGDRVYDTIIPRTVRLSEAPGFGQPITVYDSRSRGAQSYRDLAREVAEKLPDEAPLPMIEDLPTVVVPPPEPAPARAPRPLVRREDEGEVNGEVMDEARVAEPEPEPELERFEEASPEASEEPSPDAEGRLEAMEPHAREESETLDRRSTAGESHDAPDVEGSPSRSERPTGPPAAVEPQREPAGSERRTEASPGEGPEPEGAGYAEPGRVVVIADDRAEPSGGHDGEAEVHGRPGEIRKKRWSPFRRRRDR